MRASGSFNISTDNVTVQGISYKSCRKIQGKDGYNYYTERRTPIPFCRNPSGGFLRRITRKPPYRRWGLLGEKLMKDKNQNQRKSIERTIKIIKDGKEYKFYSDTAGADIFLDIYKKARKVENIQIQSKERKQQALYNIQFVGERINKFFQCGCNNCVGKHCSDCALTEALQICDKFVKILENDK